MRTVVVTFLSAVAALVAAQAYASDAWQLVSDSALGFSVLMPAMPAPVTFAAPDRPGVTESRFVLDRGDTLYLVQVEQFGQGSVVPKPDQANWNFVANSYAKGSGMTVTSEKPVTFAGAKGVEILFADPKSMDRVKADVVLSGARQYWVFALGSDTFLAGPDAARFFKSFQIQSQ
jgi:hypothetical protein